MRVSGVGLLGQVLWWAGSAKSGRVSKEDVTLRGIVGHMGGGWADQWADTNRLPYYGRTRTRPVAVGPLLTTLDGRWTGEPYPSPDR